MHPKTLDPARPSTWLAALGVTDAPVPRAGVTTALTFFTRFMGSLPPEERLSFIRGMDLHSPVRTIVLSPPAVVAAFRYAAQNPYRLFYTRAGTSPHNLGVNPNGRSFRRFRVIHPVEVLESRCTSARETWTDPDSRAAFAGGGIQYVIPRSDQVLSLIP